MNPSISSPLYLQKVEHVVTITVGVAFPRAGLELTSTVVTVKVLHFLYNT